MSKLYVRKSESTMWFKIVAFMQNAEGDEYVLDVYGDRHFFKDNDHDIIDIEHQTLYKYLEFGPGGVYFEGTM